MSVAILGKLALLVLFGVGLLSIALAMLGAHRKSARLIEAAVQAVYATAAVAAFASSLIIYAFLADDFSIQYVHATSDSAMPLFYKVTAFWGGLDGSMLFWVLLLSVFSALAVQANRRRHEELIPHVVWILAAINLFFVAILIFVKNPFEPFILEHELAGNARGLNPLLQNAYMVIHPPSLYLGYVSLAVPYAFGMAAVITGQVDAAWQQSVRRWTLFSWTFLTLGLILGGLWAYEELGWGGYWAWDPSRTPG
jgi:cytochrome c-type biogenesis protein CcmF